MSEFTPYVCMQTNSKCYKQTVKMTPVGILWHSTGANNPYLKRYVQPADNSANKNADLNKLGKNTYLRRLDCSRCYNLGTDNEGTALDVSNCKNLQEINASVTKITTVNFPQDTALVSCNLSNTNIFVCLKPREEFNAIFALAIKDL